MDLGSGGCSSTHHIDVLNIKRSHGAKSMPFQPHPNLHPHGELTLIFVCIFPICLEKKKITVYSLPLGPCHLPVCIRAQHLTDDGQSPMFYIKYLNLKAHVCIVRRGLSNMMQALGEQEAQVLVKTSHLNKQSHSHNEMMWPSPERVLPWRGPTYSYGALSTMVWKVATSYS